MFCVERFNMRFIAIERQFRVPICNAAKRHGKYHKCTLNWLQYMTDFQWIVCLCLPKRSKVTKCCNHVIWSEWIKQVKECPFKCSSNSDFYEEHELMNKMLANGFSECPVCDQSIPTSNMKSHLNKCEASELFNQGIVLGTQNSTIIY